MECSELLAADLPASEQLLFESGTACIGAVRCPPDRPEFRDCGPARSFCFVFPRSAVIIRRGNETFTEDPTVVAFYNRTDEYERRELSPDGDRCEWFAFAPVVLRDALQPYDADAASDERRPFRIPSAHSDASLYLRQRLLVERVVRDPNVDPLWVEEQIMGLLDAVIEAAYDRRPSAHCTPQARALAHTARHLVARRYSERVTLQALANELGMSVFHLCRAFRAVHGTTLHRCLTSLRVRHAVERVEDAGADLSQVALELGFSHHSHFTAAFRREFGCTPSVVRRRLQESGTAEGAQRAEA